MHADSQFGVVLFRAMKPKQIDALAKYAASHHAVTNAQLRGPVWRGLLPRRYRPATDLVVSSEQLEKIREHNAVIDAARPMLAIDPRGQLSRLLSSPGCDRSLRRMILAAVQAKTPARQRRLERAVQRELARRGI